MHRFGQAKIDDFGNRFAVIEADQDVGRFQIAMNHTFLMGMLHCLADRNKQFQACLDGQLGIITVLDKWAPPLTYSMAK